MEDPRLGGLDGDPRGKSQRGLDLAGDLQARKGAGQQVEGDLGGKELRPGRLGQREQRAALFEEGVDSRRPELRRRQDCGGNRPP